MKGLKLPPVLIFAILPELSRDECNFQSSGNPSDDLLKDVGLNGLANGCG